jgi:hypothetical protein
LNQDNIMGLRRGVGSRERLGAVRVGVAVLMGLRYDADADTRLQQYAEAVMTTSTVPLESTPNSWWVRLTLAIVGTGSVILALLLVQSPKGQLVRLVFLAGGLLAILFALLNSFRPTRLEFAFLALATWVGMFASLLATREFPGGDYWQVWHGFPYRWLIGTVAHWDVAEGVGLTWRIYLEGFVVDYLFWFYSLALVTFPLRLVRIVTGGPSSRLTGHV